MKFPRNVVTVGFVFYGNKYLAKLRYESDKKGRGKCTFSITHCAQHLKATFCFDNGMLDNF